MRSRSIERQYLAALDVWPAYARLRPQARHSVTQVAKHLARAADYETGTTRPTRATLCARAGVSESTWKAARRRLELWGFLGTVAPGCKRWLPRPGDPGGEPLEARCDAAVYVLCVPAKSRPLAPAASRSPETRPPTASTKLTSASPCARGPERELGAPRPRRARPHGRRAAPGDALAELCGAALAGAMAGVLRTGPGERLTDGWVSHLARPFARAGWTAADLAFAIDHTPDGRQHRNPVRGVKSPHNWLRWRLQHWLDHGAAMPGASQVRAARAAADRAAAAELADELAARAAAWVDPGPRAAAIRHALGWPAPA